MRVWYSKKDTLQLRNVVFTEISLLDIEINNKFVKLIIQKKINNNWLNIY